MAFIDNDYYVDFSEVLVDSAEVYYQEAYVLEGSSDPAWIKHAMLEAVPGLSGDVADIIIGFIDQSIQLFDISSSEKEIAVKIYNFLRLFDLDYCKTSLPRIFCHDQYLNLYIASYQDKFIRSCIDDDPLLRFQDLRRLFSCFVKVKRQLIRWCSQGCDVAAIACTVVFGKKQPHGWFIGFAFSSKDAAYLASQYHKLLKDFRCQDALGISGHLHIQGYKKYFNLFREYNSEICDRYLAGQFKRDVDCGQLIIDESYRRWQPDEGIDDCSICHQSFEYAILCGLINLNRPQHCQLCGEVICRSCTRRLDSHNRCRRNIICCIRCYQQYTQPISVDPNDYLSEDDFKKIL